MIPAKIAAFLAAFVLFFVAAPSTALADEGRPTKVYWNPSESEAEELLLSFNTVCDGSKWQNSCYTFSRVTRELMVHYTMRQRKGVGVNYSTMRIVQSTPEGIVVRDEAGNLLTTIHKTTGIENGNSRVYGVWESVTNGMGSSAVQGAFCALNDCGSGGGASISYAIAGSTAASDVDVTAGLCTDCRE